MGRPILVDTDVMVDFLRGQPQAVAFVKDHSDTILVSSIVAAELHAGVRGETELNVLDNLLAIFRIVPVTLTIARAGGILKRDYGRFHGLGLADAIIAATAQAEDATLATLNTRHYPMFADLQPPYRKD